MNPANRSESATRPEVTAQTPVRILLFEDDSGTHFTAAALKQSGYVNATVATDRSSFWKNLNESLGSERQPIDLIIIDTNLPLKEIHMLCREILDIENFRDTPVLFITSINDWVDEVVSNSFKIGITDVLLRPFSPIELKIKIHVLTELGNYRTGYRENLAYIRTEQAERKILETRIEYMMGHDSLTGLCNRKKLEQALDIAILQSDLNGKSSALIYIDLDQFKIINDLEGHNHGDALLVDIANILRRQSAPNTTISRISADEFCILIEGTTDADAVEIAEQVKTDLEEYHSDIDGRVYQCRASIGVALLNPHDNVTSSELLARSDQACYEAKNKGRNIIHLFDLQDTKFNVLRDDAYWAPIIRQALKNSDFCLYYQPVLDIRNGDISGFEVLIRMLGQNNEVITPNSFIPVAERMGLIHEIDLWVISTAFKQLEAISAAGRQISFNINLSSHAFEIRTFLPFIREILENTVIDPARITFEITETTAIANYEKTREMAIKLKEMGFSLALDDFGSGFNSFNHLKQLPVDYIKIDGGFISNMINDSVDQTLVRSITEVAKTLGKKTVAEFVLNQATLDLLKQYEIDYAQGYYIGEPTPDLLQFGTGRFPGRMNCVQ